MAAALDIDLLGREFLENPFPIYRQLREGDPVHWSPQLHAWLVSRHADVKQLLSDERVTPDQKAWIGYPAVAAGELPQVRWALDETLLLCSGATHTRRRRFANEPFLPDGCGRIARVTEEVVGAVLDGFAGRREIDLLADFSTPVRIKVMGRLLLDAAFSAEDERFLVHGTNAALGFLEPAVDPAQLARNDAALAPFRALVERILARAQTEGHGDTIVADLLAPNRNGERLPIDEVITLVFSFLLAGTEANGSLISMGVLTLLEHPEQLAILQAEPQRYQAAIREILRYRNFTKFLPRYVREDFELHGRRLERGQVVLLLFQSAFRDPAAFIDPDRFDVTRPRGNELPFGSGLHRCVGERMAEIEGALALRDFFKRFPRASLRDGQESWAKHHMLIAVPTAIPVVPVLLA